MNLTNSFLHFYAWRYNTNLFIITSQSIFSNVLKNMKMNSFNGNRTLFGGPTTLTLFFYRPRKTTSNKWLYHKQPTTFMAWPRSCKQSTEKNQICLHRKGYQNPQLMTSRWSMILIGSGIKMWRAQLVFEIYLFYTDQKRADLLPKSASRLTCT